MKSVFGSILFLSSFLSGVFCQFCSCDCGPLFDKAFPVEAPPPGAADDFGNAARVVTSRIAGASKGIVP